MYKSASKLLKTINMHAANDDRVPYESLPQMDTLDTDLDYLKNQGFITKDMLQAPTLTIKGKTYFKESRQTNWDNFVHSFIYPVSVAIASGIVGFLLGHYS